MKKGVEIPVGAMLAETPEKAVKAKRASVPTARQPVKAGNAGYARGFFAGFLVIAILVAALAAGVYFNVGGIATTALQLLELDAQEARIRETRTFELDRRSAELDAASAALELDKKALDKTRKDLDRRTIDMKALEEKNKAVSAGLSAEQADLDSVVAIYEAMEPAKAAAVLSVSADKTLLVRVLKNMAKTRVSQILGQMDATKAAELLSLLAGAPVAGQTT